VLAEKDHREARTGAQHPHVEVNARKGALQSPKTLNAENKGLYARGESRICRKSL